MYTLCTILYLVIAFLIHTTFCYFDIGPDSEDTWAFLLWPLIPLLALAFIWSTAVNDSAKKLSRNLKNKWSKEARAIRKIQRSL